MIQFTKKQPESFSLLSWVLSARNKISLVGKSELFQYLFVDQGELICTDSARMHIIKKNEKEFLDIGINLEDGWYNVIRQTKTEIFLEKEEIDFTQVQTVDFRSVIPEYPENEIDSIEKIKKRDGI